MHTKIMDEVVSVSVSSVNGIGFIRSDESLLIIPDEWHKRSIIYDALESEIALALEIIPQFFDPEYTDPILFLQDVRYVCMDSNLAIKTDDSLWIWGNNDFGQIGDGTTYSRIIPVKVMDNVRSATGRPYRVAISNDGGLCGHGVVCEQCI